MPPLFQRRFNNFIAPVCTGAFLLVGKQFTLGKSERLKSRKSIEQLFDGGHRFSYTPFRVFYMLNGKPGLRFGAGVSSKNFKKAVDRNRIKRLTKEAYRLQKNGLQQQLKEKNAGLDLFVIYTGKELPEYKNVYKSITAILHKLNDNIAQ